jgi:hypothetical protein
MHHHDTNDCKLAELIVLKQRQLGDDVGAARHLVCVLHRRPGIRARR